MNLLVILIEIVLLELSGPSPPMHDCRLMLSLNIHTSIYIYILRSRDCLWVSVAAGRCGFVRSLCHKLGPVHTCSGSRSGPVPVPFHSFVERSHLEKLTGTVPVSGQWPVHTCSGTQPERVVRLTHPTPPPAHQVVRLLMI